MKTHNTPVNVVRKLLLFSLVLLCLEAAPVAAASSVRLDHSFRAFVPAYNDLVSAAAIQPDGKLLVAGEFQFVNGLGIAKIIRLNPDGSIDTSFNQNCCRLGGIHNQFITDIKVLPDGKILLRGVFGIFNGLYMQTLLIRLNPDGTMDTTFRSTYNTGHSGFIGFQSDGKLIITDLEIGRLNPDGSSDAAFNRTLVLRAQAMTIMPNDKIIVGGNSSLSSLDPPSPYLRRLNADGTPDIELQFTGTAFTALHALPDGKLLVGTDKGLFRYNADGSIDSTFPRLAGAVYDIKLTADNKILVGGYGVRRLLPNGSIDPTFSVLSTTFNVRHLEIQADGKIIAAGLPFVVPGSPTPKVILRFEPDGALDETYNVTLASISGIGRDVTKIVPQPDGKVLALGYYPKRDDVTIKGVVRLNNDGSLDNGFTPFLRFTVYDFALQSDGKILIAAEGDASSQQDVFLGRINADGSPDNSFNSPFTGNSGVIDSITVQPDGKILLTGSWRSGSAPANNLVRLNPDGSIDSGFNIVSGLSRDLFRKSFLQPNGQIITFGGAGIARYNGNGSPDTNFSAPFTGINDVAVQRDGKLLVASPFTHGFIRLYVNGARDFTFAPSQQFRVLTIKIQKNNKILVGGRADDSPLMGLGRLNPNGHRDWGSNPLTSSSHINDIELQPDGKILLGGDTIVVSGFTRFGVVRLHNYIGTPFDFDGDGQSDISVFRPSNGYWYLLGSQSGFNAAQFGLAADKLAPADFDGDGKTDLAVFSSSNGDWRILRSSDNTASVLHFGANGDVPRPGDFDGDGRADIAVWRPSDGVWHWIDSSTNQYNARQFGTAGDIPLIADFDIDGKSDIAVFRPADGFWHLVISSSGIPVSVQFGTNGDIPAVGDFDADGRTDVAVWRPSNGTWYQRSSLHGQVSVVQFGTNGDIPAVGDYDGDGISDIAVWRPADGVWYLLQSLSGFSAIRFGTGGDVPVPSAFAR
ncbi:MAG TPA: FG-GAP-like repeat-containing protein [Pyrinomonadaceae bacterium]